MSLSLDILDRLIGFETVSARSNLAMIAYIEEFLAARGFRVTRLNDPESPKAGLHAVIGPDAPGGLLLSAHSDVVPVEGQSWTRAPFRLTRDASRLYGRGTTDMKGFLAQMLALADQASRSQLAAPLSLVISYDEEVGCVGIARMRDQLAPLLGRPRLAIVGEPTEMQVATGHKGKRAYEAVVRGEAGHSALAPQFASALHLAVDFVATLRALQDDLKHAGAQDTGYDIPYSTVHVGQMRSGGALNIVPDHARLLFEFRHLAEDDPGILAQQITDAALAAQAPYGGAAEITLRETASYPGLSTPESHGAVAELCRLSGGETCKVAFGTEAGTFAALGIPTLVCGPGSMEGQGHKADEYLSEAQFAACARMLERGLATLVQGPSTA